MDSTGYYRIGSMLSGRIGFSGLSSLIVLLIVSAIYIFLGLNLVVWRGESGKSYVADAYCPHLGAHLGVGGVVKGDCIECPFHKWVFQGGSGDCVHVPYSDSGKYY